MGSSTSLPTHFSLSASFRCCYNRGVDGRAGDGNVWPSVCHKCITRIKILPNTTHGADGQTWRHLEVVGQRRLRPSTGKRISGDPSAQEGLSSDDLEVAKLKIPPL